MAIPFESPLRFLAALQAGDVVRYGAILKDAGSGRIVGHLQESGLAQSMLSHVLSTGASPVSLVSSAINTASGVYTAVQVHQLKKMMETVQALQLATLGVSLVGVGVSVAGFVYMRQRFNSLDRRLDHLMDVVTAGFERLENADFRQQMSRTKALLQRAELAHTLSDSSREYRDVAAQLAERVAYFGNEVEFKVSAKGVINLDSFWLLAQMWMLCNSIRVDCLVRADELLNALRVSERIAGEYQLQFERIGPASFGADLLVGSATVKLLRDSTESAHGKPFLLDQLRTQRIHGPAYIESLEQEKSEPLLVLPAN